MMETGFLSQIAEFRFHALFFYLSNEEMLACLQRLRESNLDSAGEYICRESQLILAGEFGENLLKDRKPQKVIYI